MKITNTKTDEAFDLDIKRCYLPIVITDTCPLCGVEVERHLNGHYLSYPKLNVPFKITMYHYVERENGKDEEHEWQAEKEVVLRITMEEAP